MNTDSINRYIDEHLSEKRRIHTEGVCRTAVALAEKYGADTDKAVTAARFHDLYRGRANDEINALIDRYGIEKKYRDNADLAHGKIAAAAMERDWNIDDEEILDAVSYHTTGRAGMTLLDKVIYLADAIEPGRDYPGVDHLRRLADSDLDKACLAALSGTIKHIEEQGGYMDPFTLQAWKDLKKQEEQMNSKDLAILAAKAADSRKGTDITIIDIGAKSSFADYMVLASGGSERQIAALADEVEDAFAKEGILVKNIEGKKESGWILMDYGDIIVNFLTEDMRGKYNIEKVWGDCATVPVDL
ncbi:MAG: bis(5'-nucleosyl)-tetraphosphatase (symmetrical) YqeK [Eubacteriaceae bacterium]|nr:bis(5'-nucleosyl)-tetraphosphatase (symmetrical) YqeK [Eubacteriaceae bacterium]